MKQQLVLDLGNTVIKLALYTNDQLEFVYRYSYDQLLELDKELALHEANIIVSSVISDSKLKTILGKKHAFYQLNDLKLPFQNKYLTPETLGQDRLANAAAMTHFANGKNAICIDLGTCLKIDFKNAQNEYLGGSIAPGIKIRYQSLSHFTGKLPLVENMNHTELIGTATNSSIQSGVMNGIIAEINGLISKYSQENQGLTIFMTGGDADKLELDSKKTIFADANFTLKGLQLILDYNAL
jgi:type III pantothenate kinase